MSDRHPLDPPTAQDLVEAFVVSKGGQLWARLQAVRALDQVKADALREAAADWSDWDALTAPESWLLDRASRTERGES